MRLLKQCILLLSLILLIGCGRVNDTIESYKSLSGPEIQNIISGFMPTNTIKPSFYFKDESYLIPTKQWVVESLSPNLKQFLFDYSLTRYKEGSNECDKFSLYGKTVANILNAKNKSKSGIAVAEFAYLQSINSHSINAILTHDGNKFELVYFEPQIASIVQIDEYNFVPLVFDF